jgi:hypothetical protein
MSEHIKEIKVLVYNENAVCERCGENEFHWPFRLEPTQEQAQEKVMEKAEGTRKMMLKIALIILCVDLFVLFYVWMLVSL